MSRFWYTLVWYLATPFVLIHLLWRARRQPEYLGHWAERWGLPGAWKQARGAIERARGTVAPERPLPAPDGSGQGRPLIWIHAVSVGETRAAQPLVAALERDYPHLRILMTAMTPTGRQTSIELFGDRVLRCYLPYDYPGAMARFLETWQPRLALIMETELWPNLMQACALRHLPVCLVNARLSEKSLRKAQRWPGLIRPAVAQLSLIAVQSRIHEQRLSALGATGMQLTGNLKFDITPPAAMLERGRLWQRTLGARAVVLAASTREGEERLLLEQWRLQRNRQQSAPRSSEAGPQAGPVAKLEPAPLLVIVPRHPQRFEEVAQLIRDHGFELRRRIALDQPGLWQDNGAGGAEVVVLGDSMGEMFAYYGMATVAILGGSLLEHGGQNLIESCAVGTPIVMGPHTYNFEEAAQQAEQAGAALRVSDAARAVEQVLALLAAPGERELMSSRGRAFADEHRGATRRTLDLVGRWLPVASGASAKTDAASSPSPRA